MIVAANVLLGRVPHQDGHSLRPGRLSYLALLELLRTQPELINASVRGRELASLVVDAQLVERLYWAVPKENEIPLIDR